MFFRGLMAMGLLALVACGGRGKDSGVPTGSPTGTGTGAGTGTGTGTSTGSTTFSCDLADVGGPGAWSDNGGHPIIAAGGSTTTADYATDAGIDDLFAALDGELNEIPIDVTITGAIVTAVGYVPATNDGTVTFWIEDANGAAVGYYVDIRTAGGVEPTDLAPGDEVTLHATMGTEYFGTLEITEIDAFAVTNSDVPVQVTPFLDGAALNTGTYQNRMVEVYGALTSEPTDCGGRDCFDFTYGDDHVGIYRTNGTNFRGDCIHWIGPLSEFQGSPQLNVENFDWYRWW